VGGSIRNVLFRMEAGIAEKEAAEIFIVRLQNLRLIESFSAHRTVENSDNFTDSDEVSLARV